MLPALHRCRPTVSKGARRIVDQAKIALPTIAPATKSLLPSSRCHRPRQSTHLPPKPPHRQIPIVTNRQTRRPAGSFLGGFRTPALRARANSTTAPASETLHQSGPWANGASQAPAVHERRNPNKNGTRSHFRSTSRAEEALLSTLTATAGSPPRLALSSRACGGASIATGAMPIQRNTIMAKQQSRKPTKDADKIGAGEANQPTRKDEHQPRGRKPRTVGSGRGGD